MVFGDSTACHRPIAGARTICWKGGGHLVPEEQSITGFERGLRVYSGSTAKAISTLNGLFWT